MDQRIYCVEFDRSVDGFLPDDILCEPIGMHVIGHASEGAIRSRYRIVESAEFGDESQLLLEALGNSPAPQLGMWLQPHNDLDGRRVRDTVLNEVVGTTRIANSRTMSAHDLGALTDSLGASAQVD
jgi:hypothetical protein